MPYQTPEGGLDTRWPDGLPILVDFLECECCRMCRYCECSDGTHLSDTLYGRIQVPAFAVPCPNTGYPSYTPCECPDTEYGTATPYCPEFDTGVVTMPRNQSALPNDGATCSYYSNTDFPQNVPIESYWFINVGFVPGSTYFKCYVRPGRVLASWSITARPCRTAVSYGKRLYNVDRSVFGFLDYELDGSDPRYAAYLAEIQALYPPPFYAVIFQPLCGGVVYPDVLSEWGKPYLCSGGHFTFSHSMTANGTLTITD